VSGLLLDVRPLRESPAFRRLWLGGLLSGFGSQVSSFALLYYVWATSHNAVLLAALGIAQLIPLLVFSLLGGHLADRLDRRRLVLITRVTQAVVATGMAAIIISGSRNYGVIFGVVVLQYALSSLGAPASTAFVPRLLGTTRISAGYAITNIGMQAALIVSPLLAGLAIAAWGVDGCFVLDALTFLAAIYGVFGLPAMPPESDPSHTAAERSALGGLRLVARTPILIGAFLADIDATVLSMPTAMFPVINSEKFGGSPATLGLFLPALAVGGLVLGTLSGRVTRSPRPGVLMLIGGLAWGLSLAGFGFSNSIWLAIPCLAVAGAGDSMSVIARGTIVQHVTPDVYRGRVNALNFVVGAGGPQLGNVRASLVASVSTGAESLVLGGLCAAIGTVLIATVTPQLRRYRLEPAPSPPVEG
jgi:MFS family permease